MRRRLAVAVAAGAALATPGCAELITDILEYGSIEVEAVRRNGEPVPGVELLLYAGPHARGMGATDAAGRHRFDLVPPNLYGVYAEPPEGYARTEELGGGPTTAFVDSIALEAGQARAVGFTFLKKGPGRVTATVREPEGAVVPEALVSLFSPLATFDEIRAGPTGTAVFENVPYGIWGVRVAPPPLYLGEGETVLERDGIVVDEGSSEAVPFTLERCQGVVRVRLRTSAGKGVAGYPVNLYQGGGTVEEGLTGEDGEKAFGPLLCRTFGVGLLPLAGFELREGPGTSWQDGLKVTRASDQTVPFTVESCSATLQARVRDQAGAPLPGATLTLFSGTDDLGSDVTDASGDRGFAVTLCREYGVRVSPPSGYSVVAGRGTSFRDGLRPRNDSTVTLPFVAEICGGEIAVTVRDAGGAPFPDAVLDLFTGSGTLERARSGADGTHTFTPRVCGAEYGVRVLPGAGYSVVEGRGSSFFDGLAPRWNAPVAVAFTVRRR